MKLLSFAAVLTLLSAPAFANCYQGPFDAFFKDFSADIALQEAVTADKVKVSLLGDDPELHSIDQNIPREDLLWPLVPNLTQFERSGGSVRYEERPEGQAVTLSGDSGYLMTLIFTAAPCWKLVSIIDESM